MKKVILAAAFTMSSFAYAGTHVVFTDADEASIRATAAKINKDRNCKVYAVEVNNGGYRVDRFGNLQPTSPKAAVKYSCNNDDD